jgi:hypothetical protein
MKAASPYATQVITTPSPPAPSNLSPIAPFHIPPFPLTL